MLSSIAFTLSAMLVACAAGAPLEANGAESAIEARSGAHSANIYTGLGCSGATVLNVDKFGCGGHCFTFGQGSSILLQQEGTKNPKPTASLYASDNCSGKYQSAGILGGEHSACTNAPGLQGWGSAYLYFDC
ncbi:MAG: hypothetical protein M1812_005753 [Candelaria pacifica]|nr:MAG: hypothetical protein M1812_005753 [Candelaria pacifica]